MSTRSLVALSLSLLMQTVYSSAAFADVDMDQVSGSSISTTNSGVTTGGTELKKEITSTNFATNVEQASAAGKANAELSEINPIRSHGAKDEAAIASSTPRAASSSNDESAVSASAPIIRLSPDMSLDAAYLLPLNNPSNLLKGETQVNDSQTATDLTKTAEEQESGKDGDEAITIHDGIIVIDNDLEKEVAVTEYVWKEIPDADGRMHIDAGGKFPVTVITAHSSKTAKVGDPVEGRLKVDIKIGGRLIAPKGSTVIGHISSCEHARKMIQAEFSPKRWMRPSGSLGLQFDEILKVDGTHIPLVALPAQQARIVKNVAEGRVLGVNHKGEIVAPLSSQVKSQIGHIGIRAAASAAGPFSFGIVPVAYGVAGAISPSFAFMHPVGKNVRHRRLKGFGLGVVSGLPGGFLVADSIIRGEESIIKPGDEFLAEFQQKFTGEAATVAEMSPNAKAKVHGQVMPDTKKK